MIKVHSQMKKSGAYSHFHISSFILLFLIKMWILKKKKGQKKKTVL